MSSTTYPPKFDANGNLISQFQIVNNYGGYGITATIFDSSLTHYDQTTHDLYTYTSTYDSTQVISFTSTGFTAYSAGGTYEYPNGWNETNFAINKIGKDPFTGFSIVAVYDYQYKPEYAQGATLYGNSRLNTYTDVHNIMEIEPSPGIAGIGPRYVLITPNIVISEDHYTGGQNAVGGSVSFLGNDGVVRSYTLVSYNYPADDVAMYKLNTTVHSSITPCLLLNQNKNTKINDFFTNTKLPSYVRWRGKYLAYNSPFNIVVQYGWANYGGGGPPLSKYIKDYSTFRYRPPNNTKIFKCYSYLKNNNLLNLIVPKQLENTIKYKNSHCLGRAMGTGKWSDPNFFITKIQDKWRSICTGVIDFDLLNAGIVSLGGITLETPQELDVYYNMDSVLKTMDPSYKPNGFVFYVTPKNIESNEMILGYYELDDISAIYNSTFNSTDAVPPYGNNINGNSPILNYEKIKEKTRTTKQPTLFLQTNKMYPSKFIFNTLGSGVVGTGGYVQKLYQELDAAYLGSALIDPSLPLDMKVVYKIDVPNTKFTTLDSFEFVLSSNKTSISNEYLYNNLLRTQIDPYNNYITSFEYDLNDNDVSHIADWFELDTNIIKNKILKDLPITIEGVTYATERLITGNTLSNRIIENGVASNFHISTHGITNNTKLYLHAATGGNILATLPIIIKDEPENKLSSFNVFLEEQKNYQGISAISYGYDLWIQRFQDSGYNISTTGYAASKLLYPVTGGTGIYYDSSAGVTYTKGVISYNTIKEYVSTNNISVTGSYEIKTT